MVDELGATCRWGGVRASFAAPLEILCVEEETVAVKSLRKIGVQMKEREIVECFVLFVKILCRWQQPWALVDGGGLPLCRQAQQPHMQLGRHCQFKKFVKILLYLCQNLCRFVRSSLLSLLYVLIY